MRSQLPVDPGRSPYHAARWRDPGLPAQERAEALIPLMTLRGEARPTGRRLGRRRRRRRRGRPAPGRHDRATVPAWSAVIRHGLGQLTRPFGTAPVDPVLGARSLAASQAQIVAASRFGIPAQVHEECLTGFAAWRATVYPAPLSWGAAFDPDLVEEMAGRIGRVDAGRRRPPGPRAGARRDPRLPLGPHRGDDRRGPVPGRNGRRGLRARPGGRRDRRHAQALRRVLARRGAAATSRRCRWAAGNWPMSSCRRSRWRCGWAAPAR